MVDELEQQNKDTAFSNADVGKEVSITGNDVKVDGQVRKVNWGDAKHQDLTGTITSVVPDYKGKVELEDGQEFENPNLDMPTGRAVLPVPESVNLTIEKAPHPSDVIWENLEYAESARLRARIFIAIVSMLLITISVCGIVAFLYWQTHVLMNHPPLGSMIGAMLAGPPILAVCNVMSFVSQPLLTTKFV